MIVRGGLLNCRRVFWLFLEEGQLVCWCCWLLGLHVNVHLNAVGCGGD